MKCAIPRTVRRMGDFGEEVVIDGECGGTLTVYADRGHYRVACSRCHASMDPQRLLLRIDSLDACNKANRAAYDMARTALARLYNATSAYFEHNGAEHETEDCPEDDTCECSLVNAVNEAFAAALPLVEDKVSTPEKAAVQP